MRYVFDSNAFYFYLMTQHNLELPNITINPKINKDDFLKFIKANRDHIVLSAVSIWEFTTRFRNYPSTVKNAMHICEIDKIRICTKDYFDISKIVLGGLANPKANENLVEKYIKTYYVPQRAKSESWFLTNVIVYNLVLFIQLQTMIADFLQNLFNNYSIDVLDILVPAQIVAALMPKITKIAKIVNNNFFNTLLQEHDLEKKIKKEFEDELFNSLEIINDELKKLKFYTLNAVEVDCSKSIDNALMQRIKSACFNKHTPIMLFLHKLSKEKNCDTDHNLFLSIMGKNGFTKLQIDYLQVLINDWFVNGRKMHKNDINIFFI